METDNKKEIEIVYSENIPKIFSKLRISLAVTSYQARSLIFICTKDSKLEVKIKRFKRPMGIYADEERITLGTLTEVVEFKRSLGILENIKKGKYNDTRKLTKKVLEKEKEVRKKINERRKKEVEEIKRSDSLYLPRAAITTGMINIHDIAWGEKGLWVVNSTFSCVSMLSSDYSFVAKWKPEFISELAPEDRCHLNGLAMRDGKPRYVTTFNKENSRDSWDREKKSNGTLIDITNNEILIEDMIMPHSPKFYRGYIYVCESGQGLVYRYNHNTREKEVVLEVNGFTRGINFFGPLMFIGLSKIRKDNTKNITPLAEKDIETMCGIHIFNLESMETIGYIKFEDDIEQIYDVAVIPNSLSPELLTNENVIIRHIYDFKEEL